MVQTALQVRPASFERPWRMFVYSDEVTPGNVTAPDNRRKVWVLYWGLLELSKQSLSMEDAWFLLAAKRFSEVAKLKGGISAFFGA